MNLIPEILDLQGEFEKIRHGMSIKNENFRHGTKVILIYNENEICAVGEADNDKIMLKKVFV